MPDLLKQLKAMTPITGDCIDIDSIKKFSPTDVNIDSAKILAAIQQHSNEHLIKKAIELARDERWGHDYKKAIVNKLTASIGIEILNHIPGRIAIEIGASLSFDIDGIINKARELADIYRNLRIAESHLLIKIPATWEGIQAAQALERERINCSLSFVYSFIQAQACAETGVFQISIPVGSTCDWYKTNEPGVDCSGANDPGVATFNSIYQNYKYFGYSTRILGAGFNSRGQIQALAGCDQLAITPVLLDELSNQTGHLERQLIAPTPAPEDYRPRNTPESEFRWYLNTSVMAHAKLAEDIRSLDGTQRQIEETISQYLENNP
jgi:transaldolase